MYTMPNNTEEYLSAIIGLEVGDKVPIQVYHDDANAGPKDM